MMPELNLSIYILKSLFRLYRLLVSLLSLDSLSLLLIPTVHKLVWAKEYFCAQASGEVTKFVGDYTQIPRGRVARSINKFIVFVGQWAKPIEKELTQMLEEEFSLPYFEFVYDIHWELGHGWSGDMK